MYAVSTNIVIAFIESFNEIRSKKRYLRELTEERDFKWPVSLFHKKYIC